ncbi:MAG: TRAP transporter small permease [Negativicutes bacterium]|nr:TRAP transporter small permease [Negativicutes bacterium]
MNYLKLLDRIIATLTALTAFFAGLCIFATALIVAYEVFLRAAFDAPTEWSIEVSVYLVLTAGFLGMAATYADGKHITVDMLTRKLSPQRAKQLEVAAILASMLFSVVFFIESWGMMADSFALGRTTPSTLRIPLFIPQLSLPVGFLLLLLELARHFAHTVNDLMHEKNSRTGGMPR